MTTEVWYPSHYATEHQLPVEDLYSPLNDLRLANLVELTEWLPGKGQGYRMTPLGKEVLDDPAYLEQLRAGPPPKEEPIPYNLGPTAAANRFEQGEEARTAHFHPPTARVTKVLIGLNIVIFVATLASSVSRGVSFSSALAGNDTATLGQFGALNIPDLLEGQWWRLLACCFLHHGLMHLTLNMTSLYMLRNVESLWGSGRFLVLYLICGLAGSCLGIYVSPGEPSRMTYLAGASGAIWGLMGSQLAWLLINRSHLPPDQFANRMRQLSYTLLLNVGISMLPNISAAAHLGGGLVGFMAALLLQIHRYGTPSKRNIAGVQLALVPTVIMLALSAAIDYDDRFKPYKDARQAEKDTGAVTDFRKTWSGPVQELLQRLGDADKVATKLHLQAANERPAAEVQMLATELEAISKRAKELLQTLEESPLVASGQKLKDALRNSVQATGAFADALRQRSRDGKEEPVHTARNQWNKAVLACTAEMEMLTPR